MARVKVSIVGAGRVGTTTGLLLATRHAVDELVLIGRNRDRTEAEAADLRHATALGRPIDVRAGDLAASRDSRPLVLSLGVAQGGVLDRDRVAAGNARLLQEVVPALAAGSPDAVLIVVTNPVDAMTGVVLRASGFPDHRVLGLGTLLDTMRLREVLGARLGMQARDVHAYVVGEHGERQFVAWSSSSAGGGPIALSGEERSRVEREVRDVGARLLLGKGDTSAGTATAVVLLVEAVLRDAREVLPVTARTVVDGVGETFLSVPSVVGERGLVRRIDVRLSPDEAGSFARAGLTVRRVLDGALRSEAGDTP